MFKEKLPRSLADFVYMDDPAEKTWELVSEIIKLAFDRKRHGVIEGVTKIDYEHYIPYYSFQINDIIDILADMLVNNIEKVNEPKLKRAHNNFKKFKELKENPILDGVLNEIEKIYEAIKAVGFSAQNVNATKREWQNAAIERFDENTKGWKYIKKEDLEDKSIYDLPIGKEKRDFQARLYKKAAIHNNLPEFGINRFNNIIKKLKK